MNKWRIPLRLGYLALSSLGGFFAIFYVGVPLMGDSPAAVGPGVFAFVGIYCLCVTVETFVHRYKFLHYPALRAVVWALLLGGVSFLSFLLAMYSFPLIRLIVEIDTLGKSKVFLAIALVLVLVYEWLLTITLNLITKKR